MVLLYLLLLFFYSVNVQAVMIIDHHHIFFLILIKILFLVLCRKAAGRVSMFTITVCIRRGHRGAPKHQNYKSAWSTPKQTRLISWSDSYSLQSIRLQRTFIITGSSFTLTAVFHGSVCVDGGGGAWEDRCVFCQQHLAQREHSRSSLARFKSRPGSEQVCHTGLNTQLDSPDLRIGSRSKTDS